MHNKFPAAAALTIFIALPAAAAHANLVTFRMDSDLFNGPMGNAQSIAYQKATGGGTANRDVVTTFTIDTAATLETTNWFSPA